MKYRRINNMIDELFEKARVLIEDANGTCIVRHSKMIDADNATWVDGNIINFEFYELNCRDFAVRKSEIKDIKFDIIGAMTVIVLYMKRIKPILIHCLS